MMRQVRKFFLHLQHVNYAGTPISADFFSVL